MTEVPSLATVCCSLAAEVSAAAALYTPVLGSAPSLMAPMWCSIALNKGPMWRSASCMPLASAEGPRLSIELGAPVRLRVAAGTLTAAAEVAAALYNAPAAPREAGGGGEGSGCERRLRGFTRRWLL